MKKILGFSIVLVLILSLCGYAYASEITSNFDDDSTVLTEKISIDEITVVPLTEVSAGKSADAEKNSNFDDDSMILTEEISIDEITIVPITEVSVGRSANAYRRLEFAGCTQNGVWTNMETYFIADGENAVLDVDVCVWVPETNNIHIGFYNPEEGIGYFKEKSGGNISGKNTFHSLPGGDYWVYIRNVGKPTLSTGYMLYNVG